MKPFGKFLVSAFVAASVLCSNQAHAVFVPVFDKLDLQDKRDFISHILNSAMKLMVDQGMTADAVKFKKLFEDVNGERSLGMKNFLFNLKAARLADTNNQTLPTPGPRVHVEHALMVTLTDAHIALPKGIEDIADGFYPSHTDSYKTSVSTTQPTTRPSTPQPTLVMGPANPQPQPASP